MPTIAPTADVRPRLDHLHEAFHKRHVRVVLDEVGQRLFPHVLRLCISRHRGKRRVDIGASTTQRVHLVEQLVERRLADHALETVVHTDLMQGESVTLLVVQRVIDLSVDRDDTLVLERDGLDQPFVGDGEHRRSASADFLTSEERFEPRLPVLCREVEDGDALT